MGRNTKWIESLPDDSVEQVARRALAARLERLWFYLERSVSQSSSETENVHQLRVFSRRAAASMEIFADWLPRRRGHWMRKRIKRVRKAAGEARDLDVLILRWTGAEHQIPSAQAALLLEQAKRRRRRAQWPIEDVLHQLLDKRFERRAKKFVKRVRFRGEQALCDDRIGCLARAALGRLVRPYLQTAAAGHVDAAGLHAFRIQGKEVRYAMEVFAGAFDADFRGQLYPLVADLQDRLGAINDHVTAQTYLETWRQQSQSPAVHQAIDVGLRHEQLAFEQSRQEFLNGWTPERRAELERAFSRYVPLEEPTPAAPPQSEPPAAAGFA